MIELVRTRCCGLHEWDKIGEYRDYNKMLLDMLPQLQRYGARLPPLILFSGVSKRHREDHTGVDRQDNYGAAFKEFIGENGFGDVIESRSVVNPNTNNHIMAWIWHPRWDRLTPYMTKLKEKVDADKAAEAARNRQRVISVLQDIPVYQSAEYFNIING